MNKQRRLTILLFMLMFVALPGGPAAQNVPKVYLLGLLGCGPPPSNTSDVVTNLRIEHINMTLLGRHRIRTPDAVRRPVMMPAANPNDRTCRALFLGTPLPVR